MVIYAIIALVLRLALVFQLWKEGRLALSARTRTITNAIFFANAASLLVGLFVYPFTTALLVVLGIRLWKRYKRGEKLTEAIILFILTLIIFLKGPGEFSIDKLLGNI